MVAPQGYYKQNKLPAYQKILEMALYTLYHTHSKLQKL